MRVLDKILDNTPTLKQIDQMAKLRIRNLQAFAELQAFNDSGSWKYKHPLIIHMSERFQLEELYKKNPELFLKEYANCAHNVKRYSSFMRSEKRKDKRNSDRQLLQKHRDRIIIFKDIIAQQNKE